MAGKRVVIPAREARELGLSHARDWDAITASPARNIVTMIGANQTSRFTRKGGQWHASVNGGEPVPYDQYLHDSRQGIFHDRRSE